MYIIKCLRHVLAKPKSLQITKEQAFFATFCLHKTVKSFSIGKKQPMVANHYWASNRCFEPNISPAKWVTDSKLLPSDLVFVRMFSQGTPGLLSLLLVDTYQNQSK